MDIVKPQKRKQAFWEIGGSKLGRDLQDEFEQASITACETNQKVKIKLEITLHPPTRENIGAVEYQIAHTVPAYKSIQYEAKFDHGVVIATASPDTGVLQEKLDLPETVNFSNQKEAR